MGLDANRVTPAEAGFSMPAEWEPHEATWVAWPQNEADFPGKLDAVRWAFADWIAKLARGERVRLVDGQRPGGTDGAELPGTRRRGPAAGGFPPPSARPRLDARLRTGVRDTARAGAAARHRASAFQRLGQV